MSNDPFARGYITGQVAIVQALLEGEEKLYNEIVKLHVEEKRPAATEYLKITIERMKLAIAMYEKMLKTLRKNYNSIHEIC